MTKKTSSVGQGAPPPHAESQARGAPRWGGRRRGNEPSPRLPARLQHTPGPHEGLRAGTAGPRTPETGRPSRGAQVPGSRGGPGGGGGARRAGEGRPAALTRPGTAPGPPLHLSRSQLTRGAGWGRARPDSSLPPETGGRQEMTNAEIVRVRRSPAPARSTSSGAPGRVPPPTRAA